MTRCSLLNRSVRDFNVSARNTLGMSCAKAAAIGDRLAVGGNEEPSLRLGLLRWLSEAMNTSGNPGKELMGIAPQSCWQTGRRWKE